MPDRFGSHWRWRLAIVLVAAALIGYGWWQAGRWQWRRLVESGGGWPAIYCLGHYDGSQSIEAFDWHNNRTWTIATIPPDGRQSEFNDRVIVATGGKAIAWRQDDTIHVVDIDAPHRARSYDLPRLQGIWRAAVEKSPLPHSENFDGSNYRLVQISQDGRFAILQSVDGKDYLTGLTKQMRRIWWKNTPVWRPLESVHLVVVDLKAGEVASSRLWQSITIEGENAGEFESLSLVWSPRDASESVYGRWQLSNEGKLVLIEKADVPRTPLVAIADTHGIVVRIADEARPADLSDVVSQGTIVRTLPDRVLVEDSGRSKLRIFDQMMFQQGVVDRSQLTAAHLAADGLTLAGSNQFDDIVVFNTRNGGVTAREISGSSRRLQLLTIAIALLAVAIALIRIGLAESIFAWGMFDALVACALILGSVYPLQACLDSTPILFDLRAFVPPYLFQGAMVGAAILAGWYLAHGRHWAAVRWLLGTLGLIAFTVPLLISKSWEFSTSFDIVLRTMVTLGLFMSSLAAAVAIVVRPLGWAISPPAAEPGTFRFGLMQMLILISSVGMAIILFQALPGFSKSEVLFWSMGSLAFGIPLVGVLFLRSGWWRVIGLVASLAVAGEAIYYRAVWPGNVADVPFFAGEAITTASAALTILLPCLVVRKHGWAWTKFDQLETSIEQPAPHLESAA